jgi:hypothetical protein
MNCVLSAKGGDPDQLGEPGACRFSGEATDPIYFERSEREVVHTDSASDNSFRKKSKQTLGLPIL